MRLPWQERRPAIVRVLTGILQIDQNQPQCIERLAPLMRDIADHFAHRRHSRLISNQGFFPAIFLKLVIEKPLQLQINLFQLHRQRARLV